ncbi:hypothetical protein [Gandjariella thermophila]|uniref:Uncharacterized protein n=1 Tax=Gandjariella thermophila TaxID=1931992 RepID=A0A4D4JFA2_9PSEU|nr:hypothetical protein [Gandjariella thermophila]GDY32999.1 hypothetical protein GTS_46320 [Gandjariella thermophila]
MGQVFRDVTNRAYAATVRREATVELLGRECGYLVLGFRDQCGPIHLVIGEDCARRAAELIRATLSYPPTPPGGGV